METSRHWVWIAIVVVGIVVVIRATERNPDPVPVKVDAESQAETAAHQLLDQLPERTHDPNDPNELPWRIFWLTTEVNNGGMDQYFHNSSGDFALETVADLRLIGAPATADLVEKGCKLFPDGQPAKRTGERRAQMNKFTRDQRVAMEDLSDPFYARQENLNVLLMAYWQQNHPR